MRLIKCRDYKDMSRKAANIISAQVILKPETILGLATGSTPIGAYKQLIRWYEKGDVDFSQVSTVNLDEYVGLSPDNKQSYRYFMNKNFFNHINIDKKNTYVPNGLESNEQKACKQYDKLLESFGSTDLQLLGLGHNGHIGFNEPENTFAINTHCVKLSKSTREANARYFGDIKNVPEKAYTMGIKSIMASKRILVVVSGEDKADTLRKAFFGPVTPEIPASVLQFHANLTIVADCNALSKMDI